MGTLIDSLRMIGLLFQPTINYARMNNGMYKGHGGVRKKKKMFKINQRKQRRGLQVL